MFAVSATKYAALALFPVKLALIAAALANALLLRRSPDWTLALVPGIEAELTLRLKIAALLSIGLWLAAILCGRLLAYLA